MLNISLPSIGQYFRVNVATLANLPMAYILIVTSSLLGFGKLGDVRGYRKIFIIGVFIFLGGTLIASISPTLKVLFAARLIQALGEAMFSPVAIAMLTTFLPHRIKGNALGFVAFAQGLGFALGNVIGGFIIAHFSWRLIFLINVPACILTALFAAKSIPVRQPEASEKRFDIKGSALIFIALSTLLYALSFFQKVKVDNPCVIWYFAISAIAFIVFIMQEKKIAYPLLDFRLFKNLNFTYANLSAFFAVSILMGFTFIGPFYLELVMRFSVMKTGLLMMALSAIMVLVALLAGTVSDRIGSRAICATGALLEIVSLTMFCFLGATSSFLWIILSLLVLGIAAGMFMAPNNRLVMLQAPYDKQGVASGVYKIFLNLGSIFGIAIIPIIIIRIAAGAAGKMHIMLSELKNTPAVLEVAFRGAFAFEIFIACLAFFFAILAKDKQVS